MVLKITKAVWFFSMLVCLGVLLYIYASLGEIVTLLDGEAPWTITRDAFFYVVMSSIAIMNVMAFVINKLYSADAEEFKSWFYGLIVTLNIFFVIGLSFVSLINSGEKFDYERIGVVIYGSVLLIVLWTLAWPAYSFSRRFFIK